MAYDKIDLAIFKILHNNNKNPVGLQVLDRKMMDELNEDFSYTRNFSARLQGLIEIGLIGHIHLKGYFLTEKGEKEFLNISRSSSYPASSILNFVRGLSQKISEFINKS